MASSEDLSPQALLLARRIQALAEDRAYAFNLVKLKSMWVLTVSDEQGTKIEILRDK